MANVKSPSLLARYTNLNLNQLHSLADSGISCLTLTHGSISENQYKQLRQAKADFRLEVICKESYRHKLTLILNHCRSKVHRAWHCSPGVKPQVVEFLHVCWVQEGLSASMRNRVG
ncbi:hypothetical protein [Neolewinella antarctica]|uniref:Uncharacterized protein n=1 Tax=Neolewinella antarctica TaxID=442734 RepID=A0ABX0X758_9BACT|nr:hypothetical protein [Neolewinella antarctica]NJC24831.1 hypothetical protein [Neolewinella antarctica]